MKLALFLSTFLTFSAAVSGVCLAEASLTIHSTGSAHVRETVPVELRPGTQRLEFSEATAQVEPNSIVLRDPTGQAEFRILEQSYRNEPLSQALLLGLFEGKTLDFLRREPEKPDRVVVGKVVRGGLMAGGGIVEPIIEVDGKLQFSLPGDPLFPAGENELKPTIRWTLESRFSGAVRVELAYLSGGFSWEASYNLVEQAGGDGVNLAAWVSIRNESGRTFENARIKVLAGDLRRVPPGGQPRMGGVRAMAAPMASKGLMASPGQAIAVESVADYHLYTVLQPVTLRNQETKQVELLRASGVKAERVYVLETEGGALRADSKLGKVQVFQEIKNSESNGLGVALPKGKLRFFSEGSDRQLEFVGEGEIEHTPKDEVLRVFTGHAFDLVGEHRVIHQTMDPANQLTTQVVEVKVRNRRKEPAEVRVREHPRRGGSWRLLKESQPHLDRDADTLEFVVSLRPGEERVVTYTVQFSG
jgi:hypothetical protein